jgi:hypothetical protein
VGHQEDLVGGLPGLHDDVAGLDVTLPERARELLQDRFVLEAATPEALPI